MDYIQTGKDNFMHTYAQLDVCFDKGGDAGFMTQTERAMQMIAWKCQKSMHRKRIE